MVLLLLFAAGQFLNAEETKPSDEDLVRNAISSYKTAFDNGDAKALAGHWTPEGEFTPPGGETIKGREALEKSFTSYFKDSPGAKIELKSIDINMISPGVALEKGVAEVLLPEQEPSITEYTAVHVKTPEGWKMDNVTETSVLVPHSHYEHLKPLEWMIGTWVDEGDDGSVETVCKWTKNKNFMTRSFKVQIQDRVALEGTQVIGWDPARQTIRSWLFDSDGGFGVGIWSQDGNRWTVRTLQVLANGEKASGINVMTKIDDNSFTFRSLGREVDGELLPGVDEITIVRK